MAPAAVDHFTDPFSPRCFAALPTLRRLRYAFDDVEWTPRMTVLFPGGDADWFPAGTEDPADHRERLADAAAATGMPVSEDLWPDRLPSSRSACAAVAFVRETTPDRALPVLRRLRVAAFAEGRAMNDPGTVPAIAGEVDGVDGVAIERALEDGRAEEALAEDLRIAVEVADRLDEVEVRGDVSTLEAAPRLAGADADVAAGASTGPDDDDGPDATVLIAPPALRIEAGGVTVADAGLPFGRLASALGRSVPQTGIEIDDKYATSRMAMHVPREVAESLSGQDFRDEIRPYLTRFGSAYLPEIVAGTGVSAETCVRTLASMVEAGEVERAGPAEWRTVDDPGDRRGET